MEENVKEAMEQSGFMQVIEIGIPCKLTPEAIIPKFIWDFVEDEIICVCRGGERCKLELVSEYTPYTDGLDSQCMIMFNIDFKTYLDIWEKRLHHKVEGNWVNVKMHRITEGN